MPGTVFTDGDKYAIYLDGNARPLNVTGDAQNMADAGIPVVDLKQNGARLRTHVDTMSDAFDARAAAARKVADS